MYDLMNVSLGDAISDMNGRVKAQPSDGKLRVYLAELLCLAGNLDRADLQLDTASKVDPTLAVWVAGFRQLVRAELTRREVFEAGRAPEFVTDPGPALVAHMRALVAQREGRLDEAAGYVAEADTACAAQTMTCNGKTVEDFRDLNDMTANFLEVLTGGGTYYWIAFDQLEQVEFLPPQRPRDLIWRRATVSVRQGPEGEVFLPALYAGSHLESLDNALRIGRRTEWEDAGTGLVRGVGLRTFLVGDDDLSIMELKTLAAASAS